MDSEDNVYKGAIPKEILNTYAGVNKQLQEISAPIVQNLQYPGSGRLFRGYGGHPRGHTGSRIKSASVSRAGFPNERTWNQRSKYTWRKENETKHEEDGKHFHNSENSFLLPDRQKPPVQWKRNPMGFKALDAMAKMESSALIMKLTKQSEDFDNVFQKDMPHDCIVLVVAILKNVCQSEFHENKCFLLSKVCQKGFFEILKLYINQLPLQETYEKSRNKLFWNSAEQFFGNLVMVYESLVCHMPNTACDVLPKTVIATRMTMNGLEQHCNLAVTEQLKTQLEQFQIKLTLCVEERLAVQKLVPKSRARPEPPTDYRSISVYPTSKEVVSKEKPFLRENLIEGKYTSTNEYLDVHFRLLREDFVLPLREGIVEYVSNTETWHKRKRLFNVFLHHKVRALCPYVSNKGLSVLIELSKMPHLRAQGNKRFIYGSLVCFSRDQFKSILFGTIVESSVELLQLSRIAVELHEDIAFGQDYIMVECTVYFEPYFHVLKALQKMDNLDFPLKRYLLDLEADPKLPDYLSKSPQPYPRLNCKRLYKLPTSRSFDIDYLDLEDDYLSEFDDDLYCEHLGKRSKGPSFDIADLDTWPSAADLHMDSSQYRAYQSALRQELSIIQGPPGTGKTYIGLKVTQTLLEHNYDRLNAPILVICYTNHALDQFLVLISEFTDSIVRVGSRSKCTELEKFNIKMFQSGYVNYHRVQDCINDINHTQKILEAINSMKGVLRFNHFDNDENVLKSWFGRSSERGLLAWLFGPKRADCPQQQFKLEQRNYSTSRQVKLDSEMLQFWNDTSTNDLRFQNKNENLGTGLIVISPYMVSFDELYNDYKKLVKQRELNAESNIFDIELERLIQTKIRYNQILEEQMANYRNGKYSHPPQNVNYEKPFSLSHDERWSLYFSLMNKYRDDLMLRLIELNEKCKKMNSQNEELRLMDHADIMREKQIVGMTTTCAAKYQTALQQIKFPIVIIEEAAEVLESHITVCLTKHCQQLILIGDHKQLRPTTASYAIGKRFNLEISMFERLLKNNMPSVQLEVQHRMRPEIARLITPSIYANLQNHDSVLLYPPILGVKSSLFFVTHGVFEDEMDDMGTHKNIHEAKFMIKLARHFVLQGYEAKDITIITTYTGQMFELWKERNTEPSLKECLITVVDNYQGEENKIILLSLVRSNSEANIGFLKTENRVCVALSRAREGLFIIGNMDNLVQNNDLWPKIKEELSAHGNIGPHLTLQCQVHQDQTHLVATAEDFENVSEGGCSLMCNFALNCGHICMSRCHVVDQSHTRYQCRQTCMRKCPREHPCKDLCFRECSPCLVKMPVKLGCGHDANVPCHIEPENYNCKIQVPVTLDCLHDNIKFCHQANADVKCTHRCGIRKPCGHACELTCHLTSNPDLCSENGCNKECTRPKARCSTGEHMCPKKCDQPCNLCEVEVVKKLIGCKHTVSVKCNADVAKIACKQKCNKLMECGHACTLKCYQKCGYCAVIVDKQIPQCGHMVKIQCSKTPAPYLCFEKCTEMLPCGHACQDLCRDPCSVKRCRALVDNIFPADCGHIFKIPCHLTGEEVNGNSCEVLRHCGEKCKTVLQCGHMCAGTCGTCFQGRLHVTCQQKCGAQLLCGHPCPVNCREACKPCKRKCEFRCSHSRCGMPCGEPCVPCTERCNRKCPHVRCRKKCGDMCSCEPCDEPCPKLLKCGHACLGFCGDPCLPVCRQCQPDHEAFQVFFGNEDEPDARFVLLQDCGHVLENQAMKHFLQMKSNQVSMVTCPRCTTPITITERYSDYVKTIFNDIIAIKAKSFGSRKENGILCKTLSYKIESIWSKYNVKSEEPLKNLFGAISMLLQNNSGKRKGKTFDAMELSSYQKKISILEHICTLYFNAKLYKDETKKKNNKHMSFLVKNLSDRRHELTNQEIIDFNRELKRYGNLVNLYAIDDAISPGTFDDASIKELYGKVSKELLSIHPYKEEDHETLNGHLKEIAKSIKHELSYGEKLEIMQAMKMLKGHWYKCPNGHIYAIGNCGGANQVSVCNECKAQIGGTFSRLLSGNSRAVEFEGT